MYLSRLILDPKNHAVRRDLADCQAMHRTIMSAFPATSSPVGARASLGILFRLDTDPHSGRSTILVQSGVKPDWSHLEPGYLLNTGGDPRNPASMPVDERYDHLLARTIVAFRLRANPTRKIDTKSGPDGQRRNGKRVELRNEEAQIGWLRRKGEELGFQLLSVRADPRVPNVLAIPGNKLTGRRPQGGPNPVSSENCHLTLASVTFDGVLRITEPVKFRRALELGIGPGKAYGFGLLSVARPGG